MTSSLFPSLLFSLLLLYQPFCSNANLHETNIFKSQLLSNQQPPQDTPITTFFEVTKPIKPPPKAKPCASLLLLQHYFGYTYGKPPVLVDYRPPRDCPSKGGFSKVVLEWKATCKGRQFDRIFGVWLNGVELLRSCTAEPRATGIVWTVEKDITRYSSLLMKEQTLAVYLANLIDDTYTGVYHVNLTFHFYANEQHQQQQPHYRIKRNVGDLVPGFGSPADLVLPISRKLPLNDGLWFLIENSTDVQVKEFKVPRNAYRGVLEVYVSYHSSDEFWYGNPPNDYLAANNLTDTPGNGPFREVVVSLDGKVVGAVCPFTVVYTGGISPLLWRPISGIGSFDLPSYDIEITPFLGEILDGKLHKFGFGVTDALNVWFVNANLHLWLDHKSMKTKGALTSYNSPTPIVSLVSNFKGLNGTFLTNVSRSISSTGWVRSSHGRIVTNSLQKFNFVNSMEFGKDGNMQIISQTIDANHSVYANLPSSLMYSVEVLQKFPLYLYTDNVDQGNNSYSSLGNITLGFNEDRFLGTRYGFLKSSLENFQNGQSNMLVKGNIVTSGLGSTQQVYKYSGTGDCYLRNVSSTNYTILHDTSVNHCRGNRKPGSVFGFGTWRPVPARRAFLASDLHYAKKWGVDQLTGGFQ
ncbi:hypothetical protein GIB67_039950 [Kingdonia uniflora]|uniref:Peptide N-acetyl-beta-D-glucosaminyl asparaginase amidase A N-terminal domain-containing protein n=1 Tax=Kingdonia uniflora TaxID=39325 RepID=A0A7J7P3H0_9MAGN|nr:hypothetical protein GIB67_039950 [Kingdonia uniflora]